MEQKKINVGLVGFGKSAKIFHVPFIITDDRFAFHSVVERRANTAEGMFPQVITYRSIDDMLLNETLDLVVITTPNDTHYPYALAALKAGKYVVLEKPFTVTSAEAYQLVEASNHSNRFISVYHNRRYVSDFKTICTLIESEQLGTIHEYECHFDRYRPGLIEGSWREAATPGGGIVYDLGSHLIDQALCLFGLPEWVFADIRIQRNGNLSDDYFDIQLRYATGLKVILKAGMLVREMGPRYMVHGTKGSFIKYGDDPQEAALKADILPNSENWGVEPESMAGTLHTEYKEGIMHKKLMSQPGNFGEYYINLFATILGKGELMEKPEHGYNVIRIIEAAFASSEQQRVIPIEGLLACRYPGFESIQAKNQPI